MNAQELRDIIAVQLRTLNNADIKDKNIGKKVDLAKQVFNGAGKLIALSVYVLEAQKLGTKGDILGLPEK